MCKNPLLNRFEIGQVVHYPDSELRGVIIGISRGAIEVDWEHNQRSIVLDFRAERLVIVGGAK